MEKEKGSCCEPKKEEAPCEPAAPCGSVAPAEEEKEEGGSCCR